MHKKPSDDSVLLLQQRAQELQLKIDFNRKQTWICHRMHAMDPLFFRITFNPGETDGSEVELLTMFDDKAIGEDFKKAVYSALDHLFHQYAAFALEAESELDDIKRHLNAVGIGDTEQ